MKLVITFLNHPEDLDDVLAGFLEIGVTGATVIDSVGMGQILSHDVPIFAGSMSYLECELVCHMDVEGDHDLFVGTVRHAGGEGGKPWVHVRKDGFSY